MRYDGIEVGWGIKLSEGMSNGLVHILIGISRDNCLVISIGDQIFSYNFPIMWRTVRGRGDTNCRHQDRKDGLHSGTIGL